MEMTPELAARAAILEQLVQRACQALVRFTPEQRYQALQKVEASVGTEFNEVGAATTYDFPRNVLRSAAELDEALASRTRAGRTVAFPLLAALDAGSAAPLFAELLHAQLKGFWAMSYEAGVVRAFCSPWHALVPHLPAGTMGALWLAGAIDDVAGLTDEHIGHLDLVELVPALLSDRLGYVQRREAERIIEVHPGLASATARAGLLDQLTRTSGPRSHATSAFIGHLTEALAACRHHPATPLFVRMLEQEPGDVTAAGALIRLGHTPSLARLAARLPELLAALGPQLWDPHHVAFDLTVPLRAAFALDPATASERLAAYFTPAAVKDDAGAKIAHDILSIGRQIVVDHDGTRLLTGDRDYLDEDPRWMEVAARLALHPRLGKLATSLLGRLPLARRQALRAAAGTTAPARARAPSPRRSRR